MLSQVISYFCSLLVGTFTIKSGPCIQSLGDREDVNILGYTTEIYTQLLNCMCKMTDKKHKKVQIIDLAV